jgi:hypothetical protein
VLCHRVGDRRIETAIQDVEFFGANRCTLLDGELGDRLTKVAVARLETLPRRLHVFQIAHRAPSLLQELHLFERGV